MPAKLMLPRVPLVALIGAAFLLVCIGLELARRYAFFVNDYGSRQFLPGMHGSPSDYNHVGDEYFPMVTLVAFVAATVALAGLWSAMRFRLFILACVLGAAVLVAAGEVVVLWYFRESGILVPYSVFSI